MDLEYVVSGAGEENALSFMRVGAVILPAALFVIVARRIGIRRRSRRNPAVGRRGERYEGADIPLAKYPDWRSIACHPGTYALISRPAEPQA